jgi:hypothetical protein
VTENISVHQSRYFPCLKTGEPASETSRFNKELGDGQNKKKIMSVSHIPLSQPYR